MGSPSWWDKQSHVTKIVDVWRRSQQPRLSMNSRSTCFGSSTLTDLLEATNSWSVNIDNGFLNGVVFIDLKKAFDTIDHEIILRKLSYFGADQATAKWFQSYLSNRTQRCNVNGNLSTASTVTCGVPQGSILPCFFSSTLTISLTACGLLRRECLLMTAV